MMGLVKFRVEDELKPLMADPEFKRRVVAAYEQQVEANHGWGFTVRYKGYIIRFDIDDKQSSRGLTVYFGCALEEPKSVQTALLEVY
jgi:hypothetical protein